MSDKGPEYPPDDPQESDPLHDPSHSSLNGDSPQEPGHSSSATESPQEEEPLQDPGHASLDNDSSQVEPLQDSGHSSIDANSTQEPDNSQETDQQHGTGYPHAQDTIFSEDPGYPPPEYPGPPASAPAYDDSSHPLTAPGYPPQGPGYSPVPLPEYPGPPEQLGYPPQQGYPPQPAGYPPQHAYPPPEGQGFPPPQHPYPPQVQPPQAASGATPHPEQTGVKVEYQPTAPQQAVIVRTGQGSIPDTHLCFAIFVTACCCCPFGLVSIFYAVQVNAKWNAGDQEGAKRASKSAKMWALIGLVTGVVAEILIGIAKGANAY